jgi:3-deoxy-manno-octulosonate cytidylyltransferase (CMP-KDO synthetase)
MKFIGIIPARYASSRFPGKPLAVINGMTMIQRVYQQALKCTALSEVFVATDHDKIAQHVKLFGKVVMTNTDHLSGTDRCREAISIINNGKYSTDDVVINIQGDEPFIHPLQIELLMGAFSDKRTQIASLHKRIDRSEELFDENIVKVIIDKNNKAIYFSRFPVPYVRGYPRDQWLSQVNYFKHIGMYGYRISALEAIGTLKQSMLEKAESLEQLRWIENGLDIYMSETGLQHLAVDTPEDLNRILDHLPDIPDMNG